MVAHDPYFDLQPYTATQATTGTHRIATEQAEKAPNPDKVTQLYNDLRVSENCIRLLRVHTRDETTTGDAPLDCRLYVVDLSSEPSYTALSYVWGKDASLGKHILCNGIALPVTNNCHSALQHLLAANGTFDIWIDAICINQKDQDEKIHQIKLMGDVFSQARITYVWLGLGNAATNSVVCFLKRAGFLDEFSEYSVKKKQTWQRPRHWDVSSLYWKGRWGLGISMIPHDAQSHSLLDFNWKRRLEDSECTYDDMDSFFDCAWITRIWTYQEVILSPNPIVVCGDDSVSWDRLRYSVMFLASIHMYSPSGRYHGLSHSSSLSHWVDTFSARELYRSSLPGTAEHESRILEYWKFCSSVQTENLRLALVGWLLVLCLLNIIFSTIVFLLISADRFVLSLSSAGFSIEFIIVLHLLRSGFLPHPRYILRPRGAPARMERHIRSSLHEKILDTLSSRNATEPRDLSFGLHSVLEQLPGRTGLPVISHNISLASVYLQLTRFLLHGSKSLQVLTLATRHRCQGAPSWVPDYSQTGGAEPIDAGLDSNTSYEDADRLAETVLRNEADMLSICEAVYGAELPYRYHTDNDKILVVKGLTLGCISIVARASVVGQRSRIGTAFYEGYAFDECMIGDTLILIAGFHRVLVVRNEENCVKIVGAASLKRKKKSISLFRHDVWGTERYIEYGRTWRAHEKKRKEDWKREHDWTDSEAEPHPLTFLQDILIS